MCLAMASDLLPRIKITEPNLSTQLHSLQSPRSHDEDEAASTPFIISYSKHSHGVNSSFKIAGSEPISFRNDPPSSTRSIMSRTTPNNPSTPSANADRSNATIDPLSHHILRRTTTATAAAQKLRPMERSDSTNNVGFLRANTEGASPSQAEYGREDAVPSKDKKKSTSFLSRFSIPGGRRRENEDSDDDDDESEQGDSRLEGMNAHVFSTSTNASGYIPQHLEPPRYIKVRKHHKKQKEFNRMFLAQELAGTRPHKHPVDEKVTGLTSSSFNNEGRHTTAKAIWSTEFSRDGKYLAAAGHDGCVRIWAVLSSKEEREAHQDEEDARPGYAERLSAPVFASKPIREYEGHTSTVLDLSWSKNNFLLSSSMDKTVRLWHVSREECLCTFKHKDFVTSIAFHPRDDRFFLAGSLDSVLRLWSIPDKSVAYFSQLPDLITAVAFSPDGKTAIAGLLSGQCLFYDSEELKLQGQIHVRSSRGKNAKGSKITGIRCCVYPQHDLSGSTKVLITTNDSRIRMYNLSDRTLELKLRGHENSCSQIRASISDDTSFIICGSEDRKAYIWSLGNQESADKEKRPVEMFEAHSDMVTTTAIAPVQTRQLLSQSGDPIYDLCNPPPVTLLSRAESSASSRAPIQSDAANKRISIADSLSVAESITRHPQESAGYALRSRHEDGNIIVTADHSGTIKVFRQDCAYQKRRNDMWEASSVFSKKKPGLGRSGSIASSARKQSGTHSRRGSVVVRPESTLHEGDRILNWRNAIDEDVVSMPYSLRNDRSMSPSKMQRSAPSSFRSQQYPANSNTHASFYSSRPTSVVRTDSMVSGTDSIG